jgi:hypothetical protein
MLNDILKNPVVLRDVAILCGVKIKNFDRAEFCTNLARNGRTAELFEKK